MSTNLAQPSSANPAAPPDFETALARMEAIVYELEEGRVGLAEALARYEEGVGLLRQCLGLLETAERRIELLTGVDAAGNPIVEPYDATASAERSEQGAARSKQRSAATAKPAKAARPTMASPNSGAQAAQPDRSAPAPHSSPSPCDPDVPPGSGKIDSAGRLF